jgi:hypothetical protein
VASNIGEPALKYEQLATPENIIAVVIISATAVFLHARWSRQSISIGPALLTTFGIFFCFLGIALGLLDFDAGDVKKSVPELLNGVRTAFWASVFGIGAALTIKVRHAIQGAPPVTESQVAGANISDLMDQLVKLNRSIAGDDDSTMINQLKLTRSDTNERFSKLQSSFDNFVKIMAEANSKALVDALQKIVTDFNKELKEQFGENFKQLNSAVEKLVDWQDQYKNQMTELINIETTSRESMKTAADSFSKVVTSTEQFTKTTADLATLLKALESQKETLLTQLQLLTNVVKDVTGKLPLIEPEIVKLVTQVTTGVTTAQASLASTFATAATTATETDQMYRKLIKDQIEATHKELNAHLKETTEASKKAVLLLDKALEEELTKSIESLGKQLTALSRKFVEDYTPLTTQLRNLVNGLGGSGR